MCLCEIVRLPDAQCQVRQSPTCHAKTLLLLSWKAKLAGFLFSVTYLQEKSFLLGLI